MDDSSKIWLPLNGRAEDGSAITEKKEDILKRESWQNDVTIAEPEVAAMIEDGGANDDFRPRETIPGYKLKGLVYGVEDRPPIHIALVCAFQQMFSNIDGAVVNSFIVHRLVCGGDNNLLLFQIMATTIFMCGLCTFVMVTFGVRLPVFQGSTGSYIAPLLGLMTTGKWACPTVTTETGVNGLLLNSTLNATVETPGMEPWRERVLVLSGSIMIANCVQFMMGATGIIGVFVTYVSPLTIAAYLCTVVTSLAGICVSVSEPSWGIALLTMVLIVTFNIVIGNVQVPLPSWSPSKGFQFNSHPIFKFFSQFLAVGIAWAITGALTAAGAFTSDPESTGYRARTDARAGVMSEAPYFYFPYPCQFGMPTANAGAVGAMMAAIVASMLDSCGDYIAFAKTMGYPMPPKHAVNRGIAMEGLATIVSGSMGTCHGTTSYLKAVGVMIMTGVGSRFVMQLASVILILMALLGKVGAALCLIPEPVIGGLATVSLGAVFGVAMTNLEHVDMHSSRNQVVLGSSVLLGLMVPIYLKSTPGAIKTGNTGLDEVLTVLLSTAMLLAGVIAFILDNLLPGSKEMRGLAAQEAEQAECQQEMDQALPGSYNPYQVYELPFQSFLNKFRFLSRVPMCPQYKEVKLPSLPTCRNRKQKKEKGEDTKL